MSDLKPFFSFFGSKYRIAKKYPSPEFPVIIEPFAGSAGYATRYPDLQITLYDADPIVTGVWDYLIRASKSDILSLPVAVTNTDDVLACQEARWLIGFWMAKGMQSPRKSPSAWNREWTLRGYKAFWGEHIRNRIAEQVARIRHWKVFNKDYSEIPNSAATWFVDPPYQAKCGRSYRYNDVDFIHLADWCKSRDGQVVVCEQTGASWLPFEHLITTDATKGKDRKGYSHEAIWTNELPADFLAEL